MRIFPHSSEIEQREMLASFGLSEQDMEQASHGEQPRWHCAWHSPQQGSDTSGICPECDKKYFPRRGGQHRS